MMVYNAIIYAKKEIQLKDKTHTRCEFIYRKDYVSHPNDLNHTCFYLDGDINMCFSILQCKTTLVICIQSIWC